MENRELLFLVLFIFFADCKTRWSHLWFFFSYFGKKGCLEIYFLHILAYKDLIFIKKLYIQCYTWLDILSTYYSINGVPLNSLVLALKVKYATSTKNEELVFGVVYLLSNFKMQSLILKKYTLFHYCLHVLEYKMYFLIWNSH